MTETRNASPDTLGGGWQPIETAPKDGSRIDLWMNDQTGRQWRQPDAYWSEGNWWAPNHDYEGMDGVCETKRTFIDRPFLKKRWVWTEPTHWMLGPPAPMTGNLSDRPVGIGKADETLTPPIKDSGEGEKRRQADAALAELGIGLAADLSNGHYAMSDAILMIEGLADRLASLSNPAQALPDGEVGR